MLALNTVYYDQVVNHFIFRQEISENNVPLILSKCESDVMKYIFMGMRNIDIAKKLFISVKTVENHKENIKRKYRLNSNKELYELALKN